MPPLTNKQQRAIEAKAVARQKKLWPDIERKNFWDKSKHRGFAIIPRTLPLIFHLMDSLEKGKPMSSTYFALWCYSWDGHFVEIDNPNKLAMDAGFSGERALTTWKTRMRLLEQWGFIESASVETEFSYVIILNPHIVIKKLYDDGKLSSMDQYYKRLIMRDTDLNAHGFVITASVEETSKKEVS